MGVRRAPIRAAAAKKLLVLEARRRGFAGCRSAASRVLKGSFWPTIRASSARGSLFESGDWSCVCLQLPLDLVEVEHEALASIEP